MQSLATRGALAVVLSLAVNGLIVWAVTATGTVRPFEPLNYRPVFLLTAVGAVGATLAYALVRRVSDRPRRTFAVVAAVALLASFVPDVVWLPGDPGATTAGIGVLMFMHVTTAAICFAALTRESGR